MTRSYIIDVSGYQSQARAASWWNGLKSRGVTAGIVKLSEGTNYRNPYGLAQIAAIKQAGMKPSGYHFARFVGNTWQAQQEANYAIATAKAMNLPAGSPLVLDYELRQGSRGSNTQACITFLKAVKQAGFVPVFYSYSGMASLWDFEAMHQATGAMMWIAAYPGPTNAPNFNYFPGISNFITAWQWTDNFQGLGVDGSVDLTGVFTTGQKVTAGGSLDSVVFHDKQVTFSGWFASDKAQGKAYHYIILTNQKGQELGRVKVDLTDRPDVPKVYPDMPGAGKSGFSGSFDYTSKMAGQKINVIFRYTDDPAGNGNYTDHYSQYSFMKSAAWLDSSAGAVAFSDKLPASGWYANDESVGLNNRFMILYDHTTKCEIERLKVTPIKRDDVAKAHPDIYGAGLSGFSGTFDYSADLAGHDLQVIMRYSDADNGEGKRVDYRFDPFKGPEVLKLDGKTEYQFKAKSVKIDGQSDGTSLITVK